MDKYGVAEGGETNSALVVVETQLATRTSSQRSASAARRHDSERGAPLASASIRQLARGLGPRPKSSSSRHRLRRRRVTDRVRPPVPGRWEAGGVATIRTLTEADESNLAAPLEGLPGLLSSRAVRGDHPGYLRAAVRRRRRRRDVRADLRNLDERGRTGTALLYNRPSPRPGPGSPRAISRTSSSRRRRGATTTGAPCSPRSRTRPPRVAPTASTGTPRSTTAGPARSTTRSRTRPPSSSTRCRSGAVSQPFLNVPAMCPLDAPLGPAAPAGRAPSRSRSRP